MTSQCEKDRAQLIGNNKEGKVVVHDNVTATIQFGSEVMAFNMEDFVNFLKTKNVENIRLNNIKKDVSKAIRESKAKGWNHNFGKMKLLGMKLQNLGYKCNFMAPVSYKWEHDTSSETEKEVSIRVSSYCSYMENGWARLHFPEGHGSKISYQASKAGLNVIWDGNDFHCITVIIPSEVENYYRYIKEIEG